MLSPFGVEHSVSKSRRRDVGVTAGAAGVGGAAAVGADRSVRRRLVQRHLGEVERHRRLVEDAPARHAAASFGHEAAATRGLARISSPARLKVLAATGATAAGVATALGGRAKREVAKSAFGVEHDVSKVVRLDRALEVTRKPAKVKLAPVKTPLADARFGPVKKGAAAALDDALVTPARLRVVGAKPQNQVPPAAAKPARPAPGQRLNNAIAATGGSSS